MYLHAFKCSNIRQYLFLEITFEKVLVVLYLMTSQLHVHKIRCSDAEWREDQRDTSPCRECYKTLMLLGLESPFLVCLLDLVSPKSV